MLYRLMLLNRIGFALLFALCALSAGCASADPNERHDVLAPSAPPMELDPESPVELPRWFANDTHTIEFDSSGHYRLYKGSNRSATPIERGRWIRINYASISLEPYAVGPAAQPVRASLFKQGETLGLNVPKHEPLFALAGPPLAVKE